MPILGIVIGEKFERLLAAAQGDTGEADGAFSVLWRDANPALLRYARVIAPEAAEDVAADTWAHVVRALDAFRGDEASWRAWLFTTARRRAIDEGRRRSRRPVVSVPDLPDTAGPGSEDPADLVLEKLGTEAAISVISSLPRFQAEVIMLRVVAGPGQPCGGTAGGPQPRGGPGCRAPWFTAAGGHPPRSRHHASLRPCNGLSRRVVSEGSMTRHGRSSRPDPPSPGWSADPMLDALLDGGPLPDGEDPARWQPLAEVLTVLTSAPESSELAGEARALAEFRVRARAAPEPSRGPAPEPGVGRRRCPVPGLRWRWPPAL